MKEYIMALDQGTTSSRTIIFNKLGQIVGLAQKEIQQIYPQPGYVEQNPLEILETQRATMKEALVNAGIMADQIAAIGITNQRETTIVWDKNTGKPVCDAIVWQCRRSSDICDALKREGHGEYIRNTTGLIIDAYFSATKIKWIFDHHPDAKQKAKRGQLLFGTVDTWLIWNLTGGKVHRTDYSNASRTMMFDIHKLCWDKTLLELLGIPESILPEVTDSSGDFGQVELDGVSIPICGVAGDQQAALFGQCCFDKGSVKNTYGTGCFMLMNTKEQAVSSESGLLTTIAWGIDGKVEYALEGSVFIGGAVIQWLRDEMGMLEESSDSAYYAKKVEDNGGVYVVPAFVGLGAPHWCMDCRGIITGLSRGTGKNHIIRASLEAIAYQVKDILDAIEREEGIWIQSFKADGGACANDFLMQFQSDILNIKVERPHVIESTALGAVYLAGLYSGFWKSRNDIINNREIDRIFIPSMGENERIRLYAGWKNSIEKTLNFNA